MGAAELPESSGIYAIINRVAGERYVGEAKNIRRRLADHLRRLRARTGATNKAAVLQRAWDRYGESSFEFAVLELVVDDRSVSYRERPDPLSLAQQW